MEYDEIVVLVAYCNYYSLMYVNIIILIVTVTVKHINVHFVTYSNDITKPDGFQIY